MKLVQLNTWSCKLSTEIIRLFEQEQPDIACLQEVVQTEFGGKILETIDEITDKYSFSDYHYTPLVEFAFMHRRASRGNMIASKLPMAHKTELWTHGQYTENFDYIDSGGYNVARNIAHVAITNQAIPVHVLTLHGYHLPNHKNGNEDTLRACKQLLDYAQQLDGAVIVAGDFNLAPQSESIQLLETAFRNLSTEYNLKTTRNHFTDKTEVCDYIFVNNKVTVDNFYMSDIIASDHNALVLEFQV